MSFSVTNIIYLSGRRHYGKRHVRRRDTRMGQDEALGMRHMPEKMQEARI